MRLKNLLLTALLIVGSQFCFGQDIPIPSSDLQPKPTVKFNISSTRPNYVLKADDKSVGIVSTYANDFKLNSIETELISKLEVIKGHNATVQYGELGADGVIVITFKNYVTLPQEIKDMFKDAK